MESADKGLLTNSEVYFLLQRGYQIESTSPEVDIVPTQVKALKHTLGKYFETLSTAECVKQPKDKTHFVMKQLLLLNSLSKKEIVQIINFAPTSEAEVYLLIKDCEGRLEPEHVQSIIDLCKENLHPQNNENT